MLIRAGMYVAKDGDEIDQIAIPNGDGTFEWKNISKMIYNKSGNDDFDKVEDYFIKNVQKKKCKS